MTGNVIASNNADKPKLNDVKNAPCFDSLQPLVNPDNNKKMFKEIDIIQDIIKRMASNSFLIKGWALILIVATLLLKGDKYQVFIAFIPLIMFWYLDAYFLWQERMYRELYNWVIQNRPNTNEFLFDMNASRFKNNVQSRIRIMFSQTIGSFYGTIAIMIIIYLIVLFQDPIITFINQLVNLLIIGGI